MICIEIMSQEVLPGTGSGETALERALIAAGVEVVSAERNDESTYLHLRPLSLQKVPNSSELAQACATVGFAVKRTLVVADLHYPVSNAQFDECGVRKRAGFDGIDEDVYPIDEF